jgi:hypothetical protein
MSFREPLLHERQAVRHIGPMMLGRRDRFPNTPTDFMRLGDLAPTLRARIVLQSALGR